MTSRSPMYLPALDLPQRADGSKNRLDDTGFSAPFGNKSLLLQRLTVFKNCRQNDLASMFLRIGRRTIPARLEGRHSRAAIRPDKRRKLAAATGWGQSSIRGSRRNAHFQQRWACRRRHPQETESGPIWRRSFLETRGFRAGSGRIRLSVDSPFAAGR